MLHIYKIIKDDTTACMVFYVQIFLWDEENVQLNRLDREWPGCLTLLQISLPVDSR
jgi:hypothetical protein